MSKRSWQIVSQTLLREAQEQKKTTNSVASIFANERLLNFWMPSKILRDNGTQLMYKIFQEMFADLVVKLFKAAE